MTIRSLPEIKAFDPLAGLAFEPDADAVAKWNPALAAANADATNVINVLDVIGEDYFGEGITTRSIEAQLKRIGAQDVVVHVNSPGGDFFEGVGIYSLLRAHPHKVTIKVMGLAASAASVIAMAGDEIQMSVVGFMMIHNAWALAIGNRHDMRQAADTLEPFDDAMAGLYAARAEVERSAAAAWMDAETWFNGQQAIDAGLADSLLPDAEVSETDAAAAKSLAAVRRVDVALAKQGLPRSERRSLLGELKGGTPRAAPDVTPNADDADIAAGLRSLIETIKA